MKRAQVLAALVLFFFVGSVQAAFVSTTGLPQSIDSLPGGLLVVQGTEFWNFDLFGFSVGNESDTPLPSALFVQGGYNDVTGDVGLRFLTSLIAPSNNLVNANLGFDVAISANCSLLIKDVVFFMTGASATGNSAIAASETVTTPAGVVLASLSVSKQANDGGAFLYDYAEFDPVKRIHVAKDISLYGGTNGVAHVSEFYQYFSRVPEPATVGLLLTGGLALLRRRK